MAGGRGDEESIIHCADIRQRCGCTRAPLVLLFSRSSRSLPVPASSTLSDDATHSADDAEAPVATLHDEIETALRGDLDDQWDGVLDEWPEGTSSERKAVKAYVSGLRNRILSSLLDIDTRDELERGLATQYIEVKCHWTMLNTRIQHQTARDGEAEEALIYRATCVSLIIQSLEPLLSQDRVDRLTAFLAEPLE